MMNTTTLLHINQFFTFVLQIYAFENILPFQILFRNITHFSLSHSFPDKYKTRVLHTFVSIVENLLTYHLCIPLYSVYTVHCSIILLYTLEIALCISIPRIMHSLFLHYSTVFIRGNREP